MAVSGEEVESGPPFHKLICFEARIVLEHYVEHLEVISIDMSLFILYFLDYLTRVISYVCVVKGACITEDARFTEAALA